MNDTSTMRRRLLNYIFPVLILSLLTNGTKFLESKITWTKSLEFDPDLGAEVEIWRPSLDVTDLRTNWIYSAYINWSRVFVLGIIPFSALVFFNYKIFKVTIHAKTFRCFPLSHAACQGSDAWRAPFSKALLFALVSICRK